MKFTIILCCLFPFSSIFACNWSLIANSGSEQAFSNLDNFLSNENNNIKKYWENDIKNVIDDIAEESKKREQNLKILKNIEKERLLANKQIEFLLKQESELLGNEATIESEAK